MTILDLLQTGTAVMCVPIFLGLWLRMSVLEKHVLALQNDVIYGHGMAGMRHRTAKPYQWEIDHEHVQ